MEIIFIDDYALVNLRYVVVLSFKIKNMVCMIIDKKYGIDINTKIVVYSKSENKILTSQIDNIKLIEYTNNIVTTNIFYLGKQYDDYYLLLERKNGIKLKLKY